MSPQSEIDIATLEELQATTDAEFVAEIVDAFCEDTPRYIAELRESLTRQDLDTFRRAAHSIKSSSKIVGALSLASQAAELEQMARDGKLENAAAKTESLAASYDSVQHALKGVAHG